MPIFHSSGQSPLTPDRVEWHVAPRRLLCQAISDSWDWEWWGWRLAARVRGNRIPIYAFLLLLNSMLPMRMHAWTGTWILGNRGMGVSSTSQEDVNDTWCSFWDQAGQPVFIVLDCLHKEGGWRRGRGGQRQSMPTKEENKAFDWVGIFFTEWLLMNRKRRKKMRSTELLWLFHCTGR